MTDTETETDPEDWLEANEAAVEQLEPLNLSTDERKLVTQPYDLGVKGINEDIGSGQLKLNIQYQRHYVWDNAKASRLIESLLLNVPIPVCYFAEDEDGSYEVIDGLQRLTTIRNFIDDGFTLSGISVLAELEGKRYSDLASRDQRRLQNRTVRCIVITEESHPDIKFDVFERLNTGAASLTAQELRNCIYRGPFNDSIRELSKEDSYVTLLGGQHNRRMEYEELILRFLALVEGFESYKPPLRQFLNAYMRTNRKHPLSQSSENWFIRCCDVVHEIFGERAFQIVGARRTVNKALFDSIMVPVAYTNHSDLVAQAGDIRALRDRLLDDDSFKTAIGRATADRQRMALRVGMFANGLRDLGIEVELALPETD